MTDLERENAALRAKLEAAQYSGETWAHMCAESDAQASSAEIERDHLRVQVAEAKSDLEARTIAFDTLIARKNAHVAALVKYAKHHYDCGLVKTAIGLEQTAACTCGLYPMALEPDLAALVAREQARDAVEKVARACDHGHYLGRYVVSTFNLQQLHETLAALDAMEKQP